MTEPVVGVVVAGKYRLDELIGEGGMGTVWAATHTVTKRVAALKFVKGATGNPDVRRRFLREARAACAVKHPSVVEVYDVMELEDGAPVMVMEMLRGEALSDRLKRDGKLPLAEVARVFVPVVSAVDTAHALGIVHRDLKPQNIFLAVGFEGARGVKVLDFGIAKLTARDGDAALTDGASLTSGMLGTPSYMAPEQAFGESDIDQRADIWAMGIVLYQCLTGVLPTAGDNFGQVLKIITRGAFKPLAEMAPELPRDVTDLVGRMLSPERDARPADLREARRILERHAAGATAAEGGAHGVTPSAESGGERAPPRISARGSTGDTVDPLAPTSAQTPLGVADRARRTRRTRAVTAAAGVVVLGLVAAGVGPTAWRSATPPAASVAAERTAARREDAPAKAMSPPEPAASTGSTSPAVAAQAEAPAGVPAAPATEGPAPTPVASATAPRPRADVRRTAASERRPPPEAKTAAPPAPTPRGPIVAEPPF